MLDEKAQILAETVGEGVGEMEFKEVKVSVVFE